jgi:hypothetical protein
MRSLNAADLTISQFWSQFGNVWVRKKEKGKEKDGFHDHECLIHPSLIKLSPIAETPAKHWSCFKCWRLSVVDQSLRLEFVWNHQREPMIWGVDTDQTREINQNPQARVERDLNWHRVSQTQSWTGSRQWEEITRTLET